jgi:hypothetical protein
VCRSIDAISVPSARRTKRFPSSRCASVTHIIRPSLIVSETQPHLHLVLLKLSAIISQYFPERFRENEFSELAAQIRSAGENARLADAVASVADPKIYQSVLATLRERVGETTPNI